MQWVKLSGMNAKPLLILSVALNLTLAAVVVWSSKAKPDQAAPESAVSGQKSKVRPPTSDLRLPAAPARPAQSFDWRLVESEDYKKYIANLRAIGCPEETIRDIIVADVNKLFESRKQALKSATQKKFEYWKAGNLFAGLADPELLEKQQSLTREKHALLKELLGVDVEEKADLSAMMSPFLALLDFLPEGKQTQIVELMQKYQAKMMKGMSGGAPDSEDMKNIQKTQKEMEAELAKILTPEELENYQLRLSQTAMVMRMQLGSFEPSEPEFINIFKLKKSYDDQFGLLGLGATDKPERDKAAAAKKETDAQIKSLLGDARYADYERSQDYTYQGIYRVTERNGLTKEDANKVYDLKKVAEDQAGKVRQDSSLSPEQRAAALQGIRTETESGIRTVFGEKAFKSYVNQPGTYWLNGISPDTKPGSP